MAMITLALLVLGGRRASMGTLPEEIRLRYLTAALSCAERAVKPWNPQKAGRLMCFPLCIPR